MPGVPQVVRAVMFWRKNQLVHGAAGHVGGLCQPIRPLPAPNMKAYPKA